VDKNARLKIDQNKDKWFRLLSDLNEIIASYGLEARTTKSPESKRRAKADRLILKRVLDLYKISLQQYDQITKQADTIKRFKKELEELHLEINAIKKNTT
jgi:hypothetical protein